MPRMILSLASASALHSRSAGWRGYDSSSVAATQLPPGEQWLAVSQAHRVWALDHQAEYLLLYGHDGACAVMQRNPQVDRAFSSVVNVLFSIMRRAVAAGEIDTERIEAAMPASLRRQLATWRDEDDGGGDLPDGDLAASCELRLVVALREARTGPV